MKKILPMIIAGALASNFAIANTTTNNTSIPGHQGHFLGNNISLSTDTIQLSEIKGQINNANNPALRKYNLRLVQANTKSVTVLANTSSSLNGSFNFSYTKPIQKNAVLYVVATPKGESSNSQESKLMTVISPSQLKQNGKIINVTINELTTVSSIFALSQFMHGTKIYGNKIGLINAANTVNNLVNIENGQLGNVITNGDNGYSNDSMALVNSLANLASTCSTNAGSASCQELFTLATQPGQSRPKNLIDAMHNIALNPYRNIDELYQLSRTADLYQPSLQKTPDDWIIALHYTKGGFNAPGRMAFDARGNQWVSNNFDNVPKDSTQGGTQVTVLGPTGQPILNSPVRGGGVKGVGYGIAIAPNGNIWLSSYGSSVMSEFKPDGTAVSPKEGWSNGNIDKPQGIAFDRKGNLWITNHGDRHNMNDTGSLTLYPNGNPNQAVNITKNIANPFDVATDNLDRVWVTNAGYIRGSVSVYNNQGEPIAKINSPQIRSPKTVALDTKGYAWVSNYDGRGVSLIKPNMKLASNSPYVIPGMLGPWGVAVDGKNRVWVADFISSNVVELCGTSTQYCPKGFQTGQAISPAKTGYKSASMQHLTAVQIDESGNVWVANNIATGSTPTNYSGGDGVVELVGVAAPVRTPMIGQPVAL